MLLELELEEMELKDTTEYKEIKFKETPEK